MPTILTPCLVLSTSKTTVFDDTAISRNTWPLRSIEEDPKQSGRSIVFLIFPSFLFLLHDDGGAQLLHGGHDLLGLVLGDALLHHLGHRLDELLGVDKGQAEQVLDLLDHLGLGAGIECRQLDAEQRLLLCGRRRLIGLFDRGGGSSWRSGEATYGEIGDVEAGLWGKLRVSKHKFAIILLWTIAPKHDNCTAAIGFAETASLYAIEPPNSCSRLPRAHSQSLWLPKHVRGEVGGSTG